MTLTMIIRGGSLQGNLFACHTKSRRERGRGGGRGGGISEDQCGLLGCGAFSLSSFLLCLKGTRGVGGGEGGGGKNCQDSSVASFACLHKYFTVLL